MASNVQKATIVNLDTNKSIPCQFNPNKYSFRKRNNWKETDQPGNDVPVFDFAGGKPAELKLELFFDTTETGQDIRTAYTNDLWNLMKVNPQKINPRTNKGQPPECAFIWGNTWQFTAVVSNMNQKYTMFLPDGTPIRATVQMTFKQIKDDQQYPFQNPTSRSKFRKTRLVLPSDRLDLIAYQELGDSNRWRELAELNDLDDPLDLSTGRFIGISPA